MSDTDIALQEEIAPASSVAMPSLLDNVMAQTRFQPASESYDITRQGVTAFIAAMLESNNDEEPVDILAVNAMIADIDDRMGRQMDLLVHSPEFQELESFLLSLKLLVDRADPRENIKIHVLHATKKNCWTILSLRLRSRSPPSTGMFTPAGLVSLAVNRWRPSSATTPLKIPRRI